TQLPKICLELERGVNGMIGHTQPRRIAARSVAKRIAAELNTELGQAVGYKVRFSDTVSPGSYIKLMTDGILLAETQSDPKLLAYDTLIIDEAHERSLNIDFLLGYLTRLLPSRPDLKLIVTSATIDAARFSRHFGNAPVIEVSGRTYPVEIRYQPVVPDDEDLDMQQKILNAVDEIMQMGQSGDMLIF
ncbi:MAG: ATP-dependent helicase, partial [Candidatus Competibacteraceae bacterium]|nr:ATP-dependent helicase [Candidatus Competibacteraceae bacterium]